MRDDLAPTSAPPSPSLEEVKTIIQSQTSLEKSFTRKSLVRRDDCFIPLVLDEKRTRFIQFKRKYLQFLQNWKADVPLEKAAANANLTVEQARRFLCRKDVRAWLSDLAQEAAIKRDWDRPEKWFAKGDEMMSKSEVPDHVIKIWQEFGDRVAPKPSRNAPSDRTPQIQININPGAVEKAFERQAAIEAEISKENAA